MIQTWAAEQRDTALRYNAMGLQVFATDPGSKRPRPGDCWSRYTVIPQTPEDVAALFVEPSNIAVITGSPSGNLAVIDFDYMPAFRSVRQSFEHLLSHSMAVRTPRDGWGVHLYIRSDEEIAGSQMKIGDRKIGDLKGAGGYVIAPRSLRHDSDYSRQYELFEDTPLDIATIDYITFYELLTDAGIVLTQGDRSEPVTAEGLITYATPYGIPRELMRKSLIEPAPIGKRSEHDAALMLRLVAAGWTFTQVQYIFGTYARPGCKYLDRKDPVEYLKFTYRNAVLYYQRNKPVIDRKAYEALNALQWWSGRTADTDRAVMQVFLRRVILCGKDIINLSIRDAADFAGISTYTAQKSLIRLRDQGVIIPQIMTKDNYLRSIARGYKIIFNNIPKCAKSSTHITNRQTLKICATLGTDHDVFRRGGLGKRAAMVHGTLSKGSESFTGLSDLGIPRRTLYRILERGIFAGLWERVESGNYQLTGASLDEAASRLGVLGRGMKQRERHRRERAVYRQHVERMRSEPQV